MRNRPRPTVGYRRHVIIPVALLLVAYALAAALFVKVDHAGDNSPETISSDAGEIINAQRKYATTYLTGPNITVDDLSLAASILGVTKAEVSEEKKSPVASIERDTTGGTDVIRVTVPFEAAGRQRLLVTTLDTRNSPAAIRLRQALTRAGASAAFLVGDTGTVAGDGLPNAARAVPAVTSWRLAGTTPDQALDEHRPVVVLGALSGLLLVTVIGLVLRNRSIRLKEARANRQRLAIAQRAEELETLNASLRAANERVAGLVGMLTHDVRQPITAITGYCELMVSDWDTSSDADKRKDVERVGAAAVTMGNLVEEILTLTQLDEDTLVANRTTLNAYDSTIEVLAHLCAAQRDGVEIDVRDRQAHVLADPRHLQQMLGNLISNGMKYGRPPVTVDVTVRGDMVDFTVSDSGEGVPDEFVPQLFDRYTRATTGVAPTKKGTGLGLFIVRELAEVNGGAVTYRRQPGGACFVLSLPGIRVQPRVREMALALERTSGDRACGETVP